MVFRRKNTVKMFFVYLFPEFSEISPSKNINSKKNSYHHFTFVQFPIAFNTLMCYNAEKYTLDHFRCIVMRDCFMTFKSSFAIIISIILVVVAAAGIVLKVMPKKGSEA